MTFTWKKLGKEFNPVISFISVLKQIFSFSYWSFITFTYKYKRRINFLKITFFHLRMYQIKPYPKMNSTNKHFFHSTYGKTEQILFSNNFFTSVGVFFFFCSRMQSFLCANIMRDEEITRQNGRQDEYWTTCTTNQYRHPIFRNSMK